MLIAAATVSALTFNRGRAGSTSQPVGSGYLAMTSIADVFLQWQVTGSTVKGTAEDVSVTGMPPHASTTRTTASVRGTIQGSSISLSFNSGVRHFGTFSGSSFTIDVPLANGILAPLTFRQATAQRYNAVVATLQSTVERKDVKATAELTRANAKATIRQDASTVRQDLLSLTGEGTAVISAMRPLTGDLQREHTDLLTVQSQVAAAEQQPTNTSCQPATTAEQSATVVENDANAIGTVSDVVSSDIATVRTEITKLKAAFSALASAEAALPTYRPDLPSKTRVASVIAQAEQNLMAALERTNGDIGQANAYDNTAWQSANAALQAEQCGSAGTPVQITSIT